MKNKKLPIKKSGLAFLKLNALRSELALTQKSGDLFYRMLFFFPVLAGYNRYEDNSKKEQRTKSNEEKIRSLHLFYSSRLCCLVNLIMENVSRNKSICQAMWAQYQEHYSAFGKLPICSTLRSELTCLKLEFGDKKW